MNTISFRPPNSRTPVILLIACVALVLASNASELKLAHRWVYCPTNLLVDKNADEVIALINRAAKAGYNGMLLSDSKSSRLGEMDARYFRNVERVKKAAAAEKVQIVPAVFPIGYSESLLSHDPNLAEGLPVRDALFVVRNGEARCAPDPPVSLRGGQFDDLKKWSFHDETVVLDNGAARVTDPRGRNARVTQKLSVRPFRQYHISVSVKTQDFKGTPEVKAIGGSGRELNFAHLGAKPTQDWTMHHVVFNSLDNDMVNVYFGCWGGSTGSLWWRDAKIEEVGLVNLVRRDGAPFEVKREDGQALAEGRDFQKVIDPRMGAVPWKGGFEVWHDPPAIRTSLPEGTRLRVSFYHAITVYDGQVMICPSEPRTVELLRDEARRVHAAWGARGYFMSHDEIRVLNWDKSCEQRHLDAGAILADNVRTCIRILREVNPGGDIYVWSDMFDPNHNAHKNYYLVRGDLTGSWQGLDKDVIVAAWYFGKRAESLKWFAGLGNRTLIAGYYDDKPEKIRDWLDAARQADGVIGVMYTTWRHQYGDLEKFAELLPK
jgi:hypothetical protein